MCYGVYRGRIRRILQKTAKTVYGLGGLGRGGVLLRPSHYLTNFQSGGAEPLPYKGLCTLEELCELHSLQFLLRRAKDRKRSSEESFGFFPYTRHNTSPNSNLSALVYLRRCRGLASLHGIHLPFGITFPICEPTVGWAARTEYDCLLI